MVKGCISGVGAEGMGAQPPPPTIANIQQLFAEGEVIIGEYSPRRSRREYFPKVTKPEANNCFSIFTQVILILFISLSVICTKRRLVAIL